MTCLILCYYSFSTALCLTVFFKTHILQYVKCALFFIYEKSRLLTFQPVFLTFFLKTYRLVCRLYSFVCVYHNTPYALDLHDYKLSSRKFKSPEKISLSNRLWWRWYSMISQAPVFSMSSAFFKYFPHFFILFVSFNLLNRKILSILIHYLSSLKT